MPIINEDEDQTKNKENSIGGGTSYIGGGTGAGGGGPLQPQSAQSSNEPGTGFVNIGTYLAGSSDNGKMAGGIAGKQNELGGAAQSAVNTYSQDAEAQTAAGTPTFDPNVASGWLSDTGINQGVLDQIAKGGEAPTVSFTGQIPVGEYTGPGDSASIGSWGAADKATTDSNTWGNLSNTGSGLSTQLNQIYGRPSYTSGENALDSAVSRSGKGADTLAASQKKWGGISGMLSGAKEHAQGDIVGARAQTENVNTQWAQAAKAAQDNAAATNASYGKANQAYIDNKNKVANYSAPAGGGSVAIPHPPEPRNQTIAPVGTLAIDPTLQATPGVDYVPYDRSKEEKDPNKFPQIGQFMIN